MKTTFKITLLIICSILLSSFSIIGKVSTEYAKLQKLENLILKKAIVGKIHKYDLSGIKNCNKTTIKYLGIVKTKNGKLYKILTTFFVFKTHIDVCHASSSIKIYDMKNRYVGEYYVGMPESLPDFLLNNQLLYLENSEDCNLRKTRLINLNNGLPRSFFIPCSKNGGDIYSFSSGN